jgi:hypothetical protein
MLEEMRLMEARLTEKFVGHCDAVEKRVKQRCNDLQSHFTGRCNSLQEQVDVAALRGEERINALEEMRSNIDHRRPDLIKRVEDIALEVVRVNKFLERDCRGDSVNKPGILGNFTTAPLRPSTGPPPAVGPYSHHLDSYHRERESGYEFTPIHGPVKGTHPPHPTRLSGFLSEHYYPYEPMHDTGRSGVGVCRRSVFPVSMDRTPNYGLCSQRIILRCIIQITTCGSKWCPCTLRARLTDGCSRWSAGCVTCLGMNFVGLFIDRFGREQHESLIRQLFHIRQNGSVPEYVEQFASLVDELAAYESHTDPLYYTTRFINGLRPYINAVIMVQRPSNLDSACALALVQEEALESTRRRHVEPIFNRMAWPHATAAPDHGRADGVYTESDKNTLDNRRLGSSADRVASLKSYRRARGLL